MEDLKGKERAPFETVSEIQNALESMGINVKTKEYESGKGLFSVLLYDPVCKWQVWGKGSNRDWAMASAYGEAAERLQNRALYKVDWTTEDGKRWPDEERRQISEIWENEDITRDLRDSSSDESDSERELFIQEYTGQEDISFVPYYSVKRRKVVYLPEGVLDAIQGSNGMAAGNTEAEACAQAMCEILERYAKFEIILKGLTPPEIPRDELKEICTELVDIIENIEKESGCDLHVRDASLGKGVPVLNILLVDREDGSFVSRFGAHARFEIALERCLTEMVQGWSDLKEKGQMVTRPPKSKNILGFRNMSESFRNDCADMPETFFTGPPSWNYKRWEKDSTTNEQLVTKLTDKLMELSTDVYIRKYRFIGVYAVRIYVPGISILPFKVGRKNIRNAHLREIIHDNVELSEVTDKGHAKELLEVMTSDDSSVCGRSDSRSMTTSPAIVKALLSFIIGDDNAAASYLEEADEKSRERAAEVMKGTRETALERWFDYSVLTKSALRLKKNEENENLQKARKNQECSLIKSMKKNLLEQDGIRGVEWKSYL